MPPQRRWLRLIAVLMLVGLVAAACGNDDDTGGDGGGEGASGTVQIAASQEPVDLNWLSDGEAWAQYFMQQVWPDVFVVQPDGTHELNEDLMVSAELTSEDPQVVTYEIRPDAVWSDGQPISAADFEYMWQAQNGEALSEETDPETGEPLPLYEVQTTFGYDQVTSVEGSNGGKTVTVTFSAPFPDWQILFEGVFPRHYFESVGGGDLAEGWNAGFETASLPDLAGFVSGGPYTLSSFTTGQSMTFTPNPEYWGDAPSVNEVVVPFIEAATEHPGALENDEIDLTFVPAQADLVQQLQGLSGITTEVGFGTAWEFLIFNYDNPLLADQAVRQAIAHAFDRSRLVERLLGPISDEAEVLNNRFFFPGDPRYEDNAGEYEGGNVDDAVGILEDAGYERGGNGTFLSPGGDPVSLRIGWRGPDQRRADTADLLQADLSAIGIETTFAEAADFGPLQTGDFDIFLVGLTGASVLPDKHDSYLPESGFNAGGYDNPTVTELLGQALVTLDPDERADIYNEVDTILWEDMPLLPLFQTPEVLAYRDTLDGPEYNGYQGTPGWNLQRWNLS